MLAHQWIDNGPGWAVLRLATAEEVLGIEHAFEMRTFAPGAGVPEDPVCGSMNAGVGQWLARTGETGSGYRVAQGRKLDRAGDITVTVDEAGTVWVGGATATLFRGTATA